MVVELLNAAIRVFCSLWSELKTSLASADLPYAHPLYLPH
jgi:hypothetical protein